MYIVNFNNFTLQNDSNHTVNVRGLSKIDIRVSQDNLTAQNGGNIWARKYGMRDITIFGRVYSDDFDEYHTLKDELQDAFNIFADEGSLLTIQNESRTKYIYAKVIDFMDIEESEGEKGEGSFNITLRCSNPFFVDNNLITGGPILAGASGGTPIPTPVPFPIGGATESITLINSGDVPFETYAEFTITGTITNPRVDNTTTGAYFEINTTVNEGSVLTVKRTSQGEQVLLDGLNVYQFFEGSVFPIVSGNNIITFNGSNFNTSATLSLRYQNQFLSF